MGDQCEGLHGPKGQVLQTGILPIFYKSLLSPIL